MTIAVGPVEFDAILRHGEADYPHECCGLLIGTFEANGKKAVQETFPISNSREDAAKRNRFLIAPDDLMRGEKHARAKRCDVVGFYHSHPDCPAVPSQFDLDHAWPVYSYIIVSVRSGRAQELLSYELRADRSRFDAEDVLKGP
jgi:proteasome lid subunit RPN8/RPN11